MGGGGEEWGGMGGGEGVEIFSIKKKGGRDQQIRTCTLDLACALASL